MINRFLHTIKKNLPAGKQGFTLVETLGAVLLLSIALVGPMAIAEKGLQTSLISKDQNTAFNLAQDAIEYVRFARDTNCLAASASSLVPCPTGNWLSGGGLANTVNLSPCVTADGSNSCTIDSLGVTAPTSCAAALCTTPLNYDTNNNYIVSPATTGLGISPTIFTRSVQIITPVCTGAVCNSSEAVVRITVSWMDPIQHTVTVQESLFDWQ